MTNYWRTDPIREFKGEFRFLSNFALCTVYMDDYEYPSVEHAYQASKTLNRIYRLQFCSKRISPGAAKIRGRRLALRPDWEQVKLTTMRDLLWQKFNIPSFKTLLLDTGNAPLEEGNNWGDRFWGIDLHTRRGENHLGRLLMQIRQELRDSNAV